MRLCLSVFAASSIVFTASLPVWGVNSILIESKEVPRCADSVTVGIYFTNDAMLRNFLIPLQITSLDSGSFMRDRLEINPAGRLVIFESAGTYSLSHTYAVNGTYHAASNCPPGPGGVIWSPADRPADFISPDAAVYAAFRSEDTAGMPAGTDGGPGSGSPSLVLSFAVSCAEGLFEIDTTCIPPYLHVGFFGSDLGDSMLALEFTKSTVTIGGPFWGSDTISGQISEGISIRGEVAVAGDLTVDSGVTLTLLRGSELVIPGLQDAESSGIDTSRVEIVVHGTLRIDDATGQRPIIRSDSATPGAWYGIRIMPGGRFETGIGAVIENAVVGVSVDRAASACTLSGLTVRNCSSTGILLRSDGTVLINDTVQGIWPGRGIDADSSNPVIKNCLIDSCEYGLYARLSSAIVTDTRIDGPGVHGIFVSTGALYSDVDTLRFLRDTVSGYFSVAQMSVGAISQCRVDSCAFVSDPGGQRSPYGIKAGVGGAVRLRNSTIRDFTTTGFDSFRSGSHLGRTKIENGGVGDNGNNDIYADTTGCGGCALRRAAHVGVGNDSLRADGNWWGASPPTASWFSGKVDYNPYLTEPLGKVVAPLSDAGLAMTVPRHHSISQNYPNPFNSATEIEFALASSEAVKIEVYNILGQVIKTLVDRELSEGTHRVAWDGTTKDGQSAASGVYLYRIVAGDFVESKKMVLLK